MAENLPGRATTPARHQVVADAPLALLLALGCVAVLGALALVVEP